MAEENKSGAAQFELGKLFVDIGAKGLPTLLNGLTTLQAKFLLAKKSGEEFIKPFKGMSESASNAVVNYDKLHSIMGTALTDLQDYAKFAKLNNLDPSMFLNQVKTVQQQMYRIRAGLDPSGREGLQILGLDPRDFDYNKPMDFIMTVMEKMKNVAPATRAQLLQMLHWNEEMAYFADRYNYYLDKQKVKLNDRWLINEKEMKNLREQNDAWNVLKVTWESVQEKFISKQTWINKLLEKTVNWINGAHPILSKMYKEFDNWANNPHPFIKGLFELMGEVADKVLEIVQENRTKKEIELAQQIGKQQEVVKKKQAKYDKDKEWEKNHPTATKIRDFGGSLKSNAEQSKDELDKEKEKLKKLEEDQKKFYNLKEEQRKRDNSNNQKAQAEKTETKTVENNVTNETNNYSNVANNYKEFENRYNKTVNNKNEVNNIEKVLNTKQINDLSVLPPLPNVTPSEATAYLPRSEQNDMSKHVEFTVINNNEINQNISSSDSMLVNEIGKATKGALSDPQLYQAYNSNGVRT